MRGELKYLMKEYVMRRLKQKGIIDINFPAAFVGFGTKGMINKGSDDGF